ncbi:MAG: methyltransferase domain-containing protein [Candidatus Rokubacteria bacterium]|nr:methyltransferase domain-containing protein [Candidatus Rokubacteria bacterium]
MDLQGMYDRHPINEQQALASAIRRRGGHAEGLTADELFDFDQDHYGGLPAVEALARRAAITGTSRVLDVCAGLGGPARFLTTRYGCQVVGVELHAGRAAGAARLTRMVRLAGRVVVVRGDATALPFGPGRFDACVSQEALLHIPDKARVLGECRRVLRPGGRLAFTDWIVHPRLGDRERRTLGDWMAAVNLQTLPGYRALLARAGFGAVDTEDLTDEWRPILRRRLEMYAALAPETIARYGEARYAEYQRIYAFFVELVEAGKLGGGRFSATA